MRLSGHSAALLGALLWIGAASPAQATTVLVGGWGNIPGTLTTYTCTEFPESPPDCPSVTKPATWHFSIQETVDPAALALAPASFDEQIGTFAFAGFSIALIGTDRWGNDAFQGQNLDIVYLSNLHPCFDFDYPCEWVHGDFSAATFSVRQISPAPVPEPGTWVMLLLGFGGVGFVVRHKKHRRLSPRHA